VTIAVSRLAFVDEMFVTHALTDDKFCTSLLTKVLLTTSTFEALRDAARRFVMDAFVISVINIQAFIAETLP